MLKIWKSDLYRLTKSKVLYAVLAISVVIAMAFNILLLQDIRLGISIFGNLTISKSVNDVVIIGLSYNKILGILVAIIVSVFIGQEYLWKTWKYKLITNRKRSNLYLSKAITSALISVSIFLIYELIVLLFSGQLTKLMTVDFLGIILCGIFIYAALGSVICLISILIKNCIGAIIASLCYVIFTETVIGAIKAITIPTTAINRFISWLIGHTLYGLTSSVSTSAISVGIVITTIISCAIILFLTTFAGIFFFRKYEL